MPVIVGTATTFWKPTEVEHRCSRKYCPEPGILMGVNTVYRKSGRGQMRRWLCAQHAAEYGLHQSGSGRWWYHYGQPYPLTPELVRLIHARRKDTS